MSFLKFKLNKYYPIIWAGKIKETLFNSWLICSVLLIILLEYLFFTIFSIANYDILDICYSLKKSYKEKLALKLILSLCYNLKLQ